MYFSTHRFSNDCQNVCFFNLLDFMVGVVTLVPIALTCRKLQPQCQQQPSVDIWDSCKVRCSIITVHTNQYGDGKADGYQPSFSD